MFRTLCLAVFILFCVDGFAGSPQHTASLGDLELDSSEVLRDCQVGYRIDGTLNADRSNVIVFLTWFTGTTADLPEYLAESEKGSREQNAHDYLSQLTRSA